MIAVRLWGGLGNQLFQYSFGRSISYPEKEDLYFYKIEQRESPVSSPLQKFEIDLKYLGSFEVMKFYKIPGLEYIPRLERKIISWFPGINKNVYIEKGLNYREINHSAIICYDGYWQSFKYFTAIRDLLISEIKLRDSTIIPSDIYDDLLNSNSVSVHIRRGDYLAKSNRSIYCTCDSEYYKKAITYIKSLVPDPVFYIFSDDLSWVKENFTFFSESRVKYVKYDFEPSSSIDLFLMKSCKHNIIANSTFSWWAAWLNSNADKIVIAPAKWYFGRLNETTNDLIPSEWIRL
jgi:hypothetical protein